MAAITATDMAHLISGSDFATAVYLGANIELTGIFTRAPADDLDAYGAGYRLQLVNVDAARVAIGSRLKIEGGYYLVRAKQPLELSTVLVLETES